MKRKAQFIELKTGKHLVEAFIDKLNSMGLEIMRVYDGAKGSMSFSYLASIEEELEIKTYMKKLEEFLEHGKEAT